MCTYLGKPLKIPNYQGCRVLGVGSRAFVQQMFIQHVEKFLCRSPAVCPVNFPHFSNFAI